jgi:hypothetical protein
MVRNAGKGAPAGVLHDWYFDAPGRVIRDPYRVGLSAWTPSENEK